MTDTHPSPSAAADLRGAFRALAASSSRLPIAADRSAAELQAAGWTPAERLADPDAWPALARAYADGLDGAALAVGGSCALQEYAGRVVGLTIGTWALTGAVLALSPGRLWIDLRDGRTLGVAAPDPRVVAAAPAAPGDVAAALVAHLAPVVDASRGVSRLSLRVAWGNVASSCASVAGLLDRAHAPADRPAWRAAAEAILTAPAWPRARLVAPLVVPDGAGHDALTHERATCCLMRLAPGHEPCSTCERLDPAVRRARLRADAAATPPPGRLGAPVAG